MVLTLAQVLILWVGDMSLFESVVHSFTTLSTGGFSTNAGSIGAYSAYTQWVVIVFMLLGGTSFALHYRFVRRDRKAYLKSPGLRVYLGIAIAAAAMIAIANRGVSGTADSIREAMFTSVTILTGTGFTTSDFAQWIPALQVMIVGLMFIGGMAGSTSGAIKADRIQILYEASRVDVRRLIHPRGVFVTRVGREPLPDLVVEAVQTFFLLYMFAFMTGTFLFAIFGSIAEPNVGIVTTVSAVASAIGNVGPGLGDVGPAGNYLAIPWAGKYILASLMIVGRLEILPIVILFNREVWRR